MVSSERMTLTPSVTMSSASQRTSAWRMVYSIAGPSTSLLGSNTRLNSPQPNVGWLTRSPGAVNRTWMILPRIASSPPLALTRPPASIARGKPKVVFASGIGLSHTSGTVVVLREHHVVLRAGEAHRVHVRGRRGGTGVAADAG